MSAVSPARPGGHAGSPGSEIELPEVQMHVVRPTDPVLGTVVSNDVCTNPKAAGFVRHVSIDVSGTPLAGGFRAGQSFGVLPPGADANGQPHKVRLYSIASPTRGEDGHGRVVATTVKRTIDEHWETHKLFLGVASNYLCDLQPGDKVRVSGYNGKRFLLPARPNEHDYLFFATGTGVAPFRGMCMELLESGCTSRIALVMGAAYQTDLLYDAFFRDLARRHSNFLYLPAISRQSQEDGKPPMYVQQRLATDGDRLLPLVDGPRGLVYVCGVAGMELGIFQELARLLPEAARDQYVQCDPDALHDIKNWTRRMIHKQVRPTRRVFLEVY